MKLEAVINKLNQIETVVKSHTKILGQLAHERDKGEPDPSEEAPLSGATFQKQTRAIRTPVLTWSRNISMADLIQILVLLVLTFTLIYQARTYDQAEHAERRQARAWVGTDLYSSWVHVPESTDEQAKWHISIKNFGGSPALEANYHTRLLTLERDARFDVAKQQQSLRDQIDGLAPMPPVDGGPIFPGQDMPNEGFSGKPFTSDELQRFHAGTLWIIIAGKIFYKDIFGENHVTQFCRIAYPPTPETPKGGMGACLVADKAN